MTLKKIGGERKQLDQNRVGAVALGPLRMRAGITAKETADGWTGRWP